MFLPLASLYVFQVVMTIIEDSGRGGRGSMCPLRWALITVLFDLIPSLMIFSYNNQPGP
jgi:hypothetical protein